MDEFYEYDTLNRLTGFAPGDLNSARDGISGTAAREQAWTLDTVGNWSNEATKESGTYLRPYEDRTHNAANEVTARTFAGNTRIISYDDAGNLLTLQANSGTNGWRYTYDHRNRLVKLEDTSNIEATPPNWNLKATYVYDGLNRRVKKDLDSGTDILYIYDGWQCIEERNAASPSTVLRQYVYGSQYIDEVVCKIEDPGGTPAKLFYLHDCNYNVVALTNTSGVVQERYNYEPYGGLTIAEADYDVISATTQNNSLTFQGQRYDPESGLYYFRNRYLSPVLGRFMQRDPIGYADCMNLYEAMLSSPSTHRDPMGLITGTWPEAAWILDNLDMVESLRRAIRRALGGIATYCCEEEARGFFDTPRLITTGNTFIGLGLSAEAVGEKLGKIPKLEQIGRLSSAVGKASTVVGVAYDSYALGKAIQERDILGGIGATSSLGGTALSIACAANPYVGLAIGVGAIGSVGIEYYYHASSEKAERQVNKKCCEAYKQLLRQGEAQLSALLLQLGLLEMPRTDNEPPSPALPPFDKPEFTFPDGWRIQF